MFVPDRTMCAITGQLLQRSDAVAFICRVPALFEHLARPASTWVSRTAWNTWAHREAWVQASVMFTENMYAQSAHTARRIARDIFFVEAESGFALIDLGYLWSFTFDSPGRRAAQALVEASIAGAAGAVDLGATTLMFDESGHLEHWADDVLLGRQYIPIKRRMMWRRALCPPDEKSSAPTFTGEGANHRLFIKRGYPGGVKAMLGRLHDALEAEALCAMTTVRLLGGHETDEGVELWLEGDLTPWRAMAMYNIGPAVLAGVSGPLSVESRQVMSLSTFRRDEQPPPVVWRGGAQVRSMRVRGPVSDAQMALLIEHLEAAFGVGFVWREDQEVHFASSTSSERVMEMLVLWAQRAWVQEPTVDVLS